MPELLIATNPKKRKVTKRKTAKRKTVKRKIAKRKTVKRKIAKRKVTKTKPEAAKMAAKNSKKSKSKSVSTRKAVSKRTTKRRTPRRSAGGLNAILESKLMPAAIGGASAVFLNLGLSMLPLPAMLKSKPAQIALKTGAAIAGGMAISKMFDKKIGNAFAIGSLTVLMSEITKGLLVNKFPQLALNEYVSDDAMMLPDGMNEYMGEFVSGDAEGQYYNMDAADTEYDFNRGIDL